MSIIGTNWNKIKTNKTNKTRRRFISEGGGGGGGS